MLKVSQHYTRQHIRKNTKTNQRRLIGTSQIFIDDNDVDYVFTFELVKYLNLSSCSCRCQRMCFAASAVTNTHKLSGFVASAEACFAVTMQ